MIIGRPFNLNSLDVYVIGTYIIGLWIKAIKNGVEQFRNPSTYLFDVYGHVLMLDIC